MTRSCNYHPDGKKGSYGGSKGFIRNILLAYGLIKEIKTYLGTEYNNEVLAQLKELLRLEHKASTFCHRSM